MKKLIKVVLTFLIFIFILGCENKEIKPLRVGMSPWPGYEPLVLASELGFYGDKNIKIVRFATPSESFRALRNGAVEVAVFTIDEVLHYAEVENSPKVFLILDISNGGDAIVAKPEIKTLNDLKGKRVATEGSALGEYVINRALDFSNGVKINDINLTSLEMGKQEFAYKNGKVDALVTYEPTKTLLLNAGAKVIFDSKQIPNEIVDVMLTNKNNLINRKDDLKAIVDGWFKALEYIKKNPEIAYEKMASYEGVSKSEFKKAMDDLIVPNLDENIRLLSGGENSLVKPVEKLSTLMRESGVLKKEIKDIDNLFTNEFLKEK